MSAPAIIWLVLAVLGLCIAAHDHGKPRKGVHSFWNTLTAGLIVFGLLLWGGFFGGAS